MLTYIALKCPYCGTVQLSTAKKVFKCVRCNKTRSYGSKLGVPIIKEFVDSRKATQFILAYKKAKSFEDDFHQEII